MIEQWLTFDEAVALTRSRIGGSVGRAEATLRRARDSGEVRSRYDYTRHPVLLTADDGILDISLRPGALNKGGVKSDCGEVVSKDDLEDWLDRLTPRMKVSKPKHRYASDTPLLKEARQLVANGISKLQAAQQLAPKASGGSIQQRTERLRKLI